MLPVKNVLLVTCLTERIMDLQPILEALLLLVAFPASIVAILRVIAPPGAAPNLLAFDARPDWPRGVQEEEPPRYRVELISARRRAQPGSRSDPRRTPVTRPTELRA
jgi:hypothetical protein